MKKELIILSVLMVIAMFVISGCSSGNAIKGAKKDVSLKTTEPVKIVRNQSFCNDTDGGLNYYEYGTVALSNNSNPNNITYYSDMCIDDNTAIFERFCDANGNLGSDPEPCLYGCVNGACINGSGNNQSNTTCTDSDGGLNYYEYGIVTLSNGEVSYDECAYVMSFGTNISILDEKYCTSSGGIGTIANFCQHNGCVNGVCINNGTIPHNVSIVNNTINATR